MLPNKVEALIMIKDNKHKGLKEVTGDLKKGEAEAFNQISASFEPIQDSEGNVSDYREAEAERNNNINDDWQFTADEDSSTDDE